jgi:hypothetical protein
MAQTRFFEQLIRRPLSLLTSALAAVLIVAPIYLRVIGNVYIEQLNYIDGTTLVMVGILLLRGILSRRLDTDLQAVSIALIGALSFVFTFEAIFKLSFYAFPWRMPPTELREFVIQVGIALTALAGFAFGKYKISTLSWVFAGIFALGWAIWLLAGFPQLTNGENFYPAVLNISLTWDMIYALNRASGIKDPAIPGLLLFLLKIDPKGFRERPFKTRFWAS